MRPSLICVLLLALGASAAPLPFPKQNDKAKPALSADVQSLQGEWIVVRFTMPGLTINLDDGVNPCLTASVVGPRVEFRRREGAVPEWGLTLAPGSGGRAGVVRVDKEQLLIALVPAGGVDFGSGPVWTLRRKP